MLKLYSVLRYWNCLDDDNYSTSNLCDVWLIQATYPVEAIEAAIRADGRRVEDYPVFTETSLSQEVSYARGFFDYSASEIDLSEPIIQIV